MLLNRKFIISIQLILIISLVGGNTACPLFSGKNKDIARTVSKATDDFAEGQKSVAKILTTGKETGAISPEIIEEIKPFLIQANDLNAEAIKQGRKLLQTPDDAEVKNQLINTLSTISTTLVRANNLGLFRIKDEKLRIAFSAAIMTMQAAATSVIVVFKN